MADIVHDIELRLAVVESAAIAALTNVAKELANIATQAARASGAVTELSTAMSKWAVIGGTILGGGALLAFDKLAESAKATKEQMMLLQQQGLSYKDTLEAVAVAQRTVADIPTLKTEEALKLLRGIIGAGIPRDQAEAMLPFMARAAGLVGEGGVEAALRVSRSANLGPEQTTALVDQLVRISQATGGTVTPELMKRQIDAARAAGRTMSPEMMEVFGAMLNMNAGLGGAGRMGPGMALRGAQQQFYDLAKDLNRGKDTERTRAAAAIGLTGPLWRQFMTGDEYQAVQRMTPGLMRAAGITPGQGPVTKEEEGRLRALIETVFGKTAADVMSKMVLQGPAFYSARGLGESPIEHQRRMMRDAAGVVEGWKLAADEFDWVKRAITNTLHNIAQIFGSPLLESLTKTLIPIRDTVQNWYKSLLDIQKNDPEQFKRMTEGVKTVLSSLMEIGAFFAVGGALSLALGPAGWFAAGIGVLIAHLAKAGEVDLTKIKDIPTALNALWEGLDKQANLAQAEIKKYLDKLWDGIKNALRSWAADLFGQPHAPGGLPENQPWTGGGVEPGGGWFGNWLRRLLPEGGWHAPGGLPEYQPQGLMIGPSGPRIIPAGLGAIGVAPRIATTGAITAPFVSALPDRAGRDRGLENAIHSAIAVAASKENRPIVVSLNIDGRRIAEALSQQLALLMEFPSQAPYHDGWTGPAMPDQQFVTT